MRLKRCCLALGFIFILIECGMRFLEGKTAGYKGRIYCFGDFVTFGAGAKYADTYPYLLEKKLNQSAGQGGFLVKNFGVLEFNSSQTLRYLEDQIRRDKPNTVIILCGLNDIVNLTDTDYFLVKERRFLFDEFFLKAGNKTAELFGRSRFFVASWRCMRHIFSNLSSLDPNGTLKWTYLRQGEDFFVKKESRFLYRKHKRKREEVIASANLYRVRELEHLSAAEKHKAYGKYDQAIGHLKEVINISPGNFWAYDEMGMIHKAKTDYVQARKDLEKALGIYFGHSRAHIELGLIDYGRNQYLLTPRERFELAFHELEQKKPDTQTGFPYIELAWFLKIQGSLGLAEEMFRKAQELGAQTWFDKDLRRDFPVAESGLSAEALIKEGYEHVHQGKWQEAGEFFRKASALEPANHLASELTYLSDIKGGKESGGKEYGRLGYVGKIVGYSLGRIIQLSRLNGIKPVLLTYPGSDSYTIEINLAIEKSAKEYNIAMLRNPFISYGSDGAALYDAMAEQIKEFLLKKN